MPNRLESSYPWTRRLLTLLSLLFALTGTANGQGPVQATGQANAADTTVQILLDSDGIPYLAGPDGMTLYLLAKDKPNVSKCIRGCIENWPPLIAGRQITTPAGLEGTLGTFTRDAPDHRPQVIYEGMPLYYWSRDKVPGDMTGDGIGDIWSVARPHGARR